MFAIIEAKGKQYQATEGQKLKIDLMKDQKKGNSVTFDKELLVSGETPKIGTPVVKGAKVHAIISDMGTDGEGVKASKIRVFKKKRRQGHHKTIGHRQRYTEVRIEKIEL